MEEVKQGVRGAIDMTRGSPTRLILRFFPAPAGGEYIPAAL